MSRFSGIRVSDAQAGARIVVDATIGVVGIVEGLHAAVARRYDPRDRTGRLTRLVYGAVRGITRLVGRSIHAAAGAVPSSSRGEAPHPRPGRETAVAILNGVLGDYLAESRNPLAIPIRFRRDGCPLELDSDALAARLPALPRILIFVHGLCLNDVQWSRHVDCHGEALEADSRYTALHLHYNTGLHVSTNGRSFSELLETLVARWPVPVEEIVVVAHSMGGLVARSACYYGRREGRAWIDRLRKLVFLGTPHHGTHLEQVGNWIDDVLERSPYSAPLARLGKVRSGGITDLRFGNTRDSDWGGRDRFVRGGDCRSPEPLPAGVQCYAIAGSAAPGSARQAWFGDGLVPVESALGEHADPRFALDFPPSHRWIATGVGHMELLRRPEVYERIAAWLAA